MTKEFFYLSTGHKKEFDPNKLKNRIKFHTNKEKFDAKLLYYRIFLWFENNGFCLKASSTARQEISWLNDDYSWERNSVSSWIPWAEELRSRYPETDEAVRSPSRAISIPNRKPKRSDCEAWGSAELFFLPPTKFFTRTSSREEIRPRCTKEDEAVRSPTTVSWFAVKTRTIPISVHEDHRYRSTSPEAFWERYQAYRFFRSIHSPNMVCTEIWIKVLRMAYFWVFFFQNQN